MSPADVAPDWRLALVLAALVLVVFGPIVAKDTPQAASRYSLTAALAEHVSVDLGPYQSELGVDRAEYRGHLRSDKAPGQSLFAVPAYLVGRALGADSAAHTHIQADLGLWWNTLWSATIPFAILVGLMYIVCARVARHGVALAVALTFGICTMMLPHAVNLFGHDLAAVLGFAAWIAVEPAPLTRRRAAVGGLLAGAAVLTEYQAAIILVVLVLYLLVRDRRSVPRFALASAIPLAVLALYQWAAFGAPWHTPAAYFAGTINGTSDGGYTLPGIHGFGLVFFGGTGLIVGAPIAIVGLVAAAWAARGSGNTRRHAVVALAVMIPYVVLCAGWSGTPTLVFPGPRYLIPALPFLAVPLAALWDRFFRPVAVSTAVGISVATTAVVTAALGAFVAVTVAFSDIIVLPETGAKEPLRALAHRIRTGEFQATVWSMAFGRVGIVLYGATVVVACYLVVVRVRRGVVTA